MNYEEYAEELIEYMIVNERSGYLLQNKLSDYTRGELSVLKYLTDIKDGAYAHELSCSLSINTSRVAAILNSLSKKNLIIRQMDEQDKRKVKVYLTNDGKLYFNNKKNEVVIRISKVLTALGEEDTKEHIRIIKKIMEITKSLK